MIKLNVDQSDQIDSDRSFLQIIKLFLFILLFAILIAGVPVLLIKGCSSVSESIELPDTCGHTIYETLSSPDGKYKAVYYQHGCGATTLNSENISIIKSDQNVKTEPGNVVSLGELIDFELEWIDDNTLKINGTLKGGPKPPNYNYTEITYDSKDFSIEYENQSTE